MSSNKRMVKARVHGDVARGLAVVFAVAAGGCSADVTRFDFPFFNLTKKDTTTTGALPGRSETLARSTTDPYDDPNARPSAYAPPPSYSGQRVAGRDHSEPLPPARGEMVPSAERYAGRLPAPAQAVAREASIEVQQGDTLYGLARRYGVTIAALKEANGLQNEVLRPGQRLSLPSGGGDRAPPARTQAEPPSRAIAARPAPAAVAPQAPPGWEGRYTMRHGDSPYGIARQHGVTFAELSRVNGITDPTKVAVGTVLYVPAGREQAPERIRPMAAADPASPPRVVQTPRIINAPDDPSRTASRTDIATDAAEPAGEALGKFRWPVRGRIIAAYGKRPDGSHNDGINLAVPQGTDIHAVEGGRVAYAGDELKTYGNLILIRHANGWVSAYAHTDQMLVKRDDVVKRGQVIARAGRTGLVDQPQVHFELRQGSKPVDPMPHLEKH